MKKIILNLVLMLNILVILASSPLYAEPNTSNNKPQPLSQKTQTINVVVSIPPFHSLVAAVMQGLMEPKLLIPPGASPHHYSLKPSQIQNLHQADLIFWGGPELESFLNNTLKTLPQNKIVTLSQTPDLLLLPIRRSALWPEHSHGADEHEDHDHHHEHNHDHEHDHNHGAVDMHFWLDPMNAIKIVEYISQKLSERYPEHQTLFQRNTQYVKQKLIALDKSLEKQLKPIQGIPFLVFHDGYQYFEHRYKLNAVGAIALHPELPISLERLNAVHQQIVDSKARCVFSEPQFKPKLVERLVKETGIKTGELDPEGAKIPNNAQGYFILMETLAIELLDCLSPQKKKP